MSFFSLRCQPLEDRGSSTSGFPLFLQHLVQCLQHLDTCGLTEGAEVEGEQHWRAGEDRQQEEGRGMGGKKGKISPFSQSRWKASLLPQNWHVGGWFLPDILNTGIKINTYPNFFLCILSLSIERPTLKII